MVMVIFTLQATYQGREPTISIRGLFGSRAGGHRGKEKNLFPCQE
jgi:hypothetical protein